MLFRQIECVISNFSKVCVTNWANGGEGGKGDDVMSSPAMHVEWYLSRKGHERMSTCR